MAQLATLYVEELKATFRGRFAFIGAGVVLLAVGGLAAVATQDTWLDGYGVIAYGLVPLAFIPITAVALAAPRANRFVESVFTAPVGRGTWLTAKLLVAATLAAGYFVALLPMTAVYIAHVGLPLLLGKFLLWTPLLLAVSVAIGALIGVLFIGRSLAAPAGAGMGVMLFYACLIPLQELLVGQGNGATNSGHMTLLSPAVLLKNALGFAIATTSVPATTGMSWVCLVLMTAGALVLTAYVFLKAQGPESWEATRAQRWGTVITLVALSLAPAFLADADYDKPAPRPNRAPAVRNLFARAGGNMALVATSGAVPERCCSTILNRDDWPLSTDETAQRDLLLFLPVDAGRTISRLAVTVAGEDGLSVVATASPTLEPHTYRKEIAPEDKSGRPILKGWAVRIPVRLDPTDPWDIGGDRYPLAATAHYSLSGEAGERVFKARAAIDAEVGSGLYQMALAGAFLPLICAGAAFARWRRTQ